MRNLVSALFAVVVFSGALIVIVGLPKQELPPNPTPEQEAVRSGRSLVEHVQGFFQETERLTYYLEKFITLDGKGNNNGGPSFILTFLGMLKFFGVLIILGIIPAILICSSRSRH